MDVTRCISRILAGAFAAGALYSSQVCLADAADKVFMLLPNTTTTRFEARDAPLFVEAMKKDAPNVEVVVQNGGGDPVRQQRLVEDAISQGAKAIVLVASDANLAAGS